jgi:hypothetical protein
VLAVSTRTTVAVTGATSYNCGVSGDTSKFGGSLGVAKNSSNVGVIGPTAYYADTPVLLTAVGGELHGRQGEGGGPSAAVRRAGGGRLAGD